MYVISFHVHTKKRLMPKHKQSGNYSQHKQSEVKQFRSVLELNRNIKQLPLLKSTHSNRLVVSTGQFS